MSPLSTIASVIMLARWVAFVFPFLCSEPSNIEGLWIAIDVAAFTVAVHSLLSSQLVLQTLTILIVMKIRSPTEAILHSKSMLDL